MPLGEARVGVSTARAASRRDSPRPRPSTAMSSNDRVRVRVRQFTLLVVPLTEHAHQGVTIHRPIIFGSTAVVLDEKERANAPPEHTHRWTVAVRSAASAPDSDIVGGADDLSYFIKRVTFKLHETYANPSRSEWLSVFPSVSYPMSLHRCG